MPVDYYTSIKAAKQLACGFYLHISYSYKYVHFHETEHKLVVKLLAGEKYWLKTYLL